MVTKLLSVGTAHPKTSFTQKEAAAILNIRSVKALRFFQHPHIHKRHLLFPDHAPGEKEFREETPGELRAKFLTHALPLSEEAITKALTNAGLSLQDISYIACVTSTGFLVPGLSALLIEEMNLKHNMQRLDIVGMGCNAGLNGLNAVASWSKSNPGKVAVLLCCELASCIYSLGDDENTALVNSLFGDGVAAAIVCSGSVTGPQPEIIGFESHIIPDSRDCLRFNFLPDRQRYNFYVDKQTPEKLGSAVRTPLTSLLSVHNLTLKDVRHWILHTGGEAILSAISRELFLSEENLKHTRSILRDFGNISSGSFLFTYARLLKEKAPEGYGIMMTMGPGLTIECGLLKW